MRAIDVENEVIDLTSVEDINEDELVESGDLDAFTAAFNRGNRLA